MQQKRWLTSEGQGLTTNTVKAVPPQAEGTPGPQGHQCLPEDSGLHPGVSGGPPSIRSLPLVPAPPGWLTHGRPQH